MTPPKPIEARSRTYRFKCEPPCAGLICPGHLVRASLDADHFETVTIFTQTLDGEDVGQETDYTRPQLGAMMMAYENAAAALTRALKRRERLSQKPVKYAYIVNLRRKVFHTSYDNGRTGSDVRCSTSRMERHDRRVLKSRKEAERLAKPCSRCVPPKRKTAEEKAEEEALRLAKRAERERLGLNAFGKPIKKKAQEPMSADSDDLGNPLTIADEASFDLRRVN